MFWPFKRKKKEKQPLDPKLSPDEYNKRVCRTAAISKHPHPIPGELIPLTDYPVAWINKVNAIKMCRALTGLGLKGAKAMVDKWAEEDALEMVQWP